MKVKPDLPRLVWLQAPGHSDGVALCSRASLDEATEVSLLALVGNRYAIRDLQQVAILDRSTRKAWECGAKGDGPDTRRDNSVTLARYRYSYFT